MTSTPPIIKAPRFTVLLPELDEADMRALTAAVNEYTQALNQHVAELAALTVEALIASGRPIDPARLPDLLRNIKAVKL
ncbi:hypothetical protein P3G55_23595 [Leptospira sp. 96542]|nr:hypothetical protein [Leptospira sp. 96542]